MATVNVTISPAITGVYIVLEDTTNNTCETLTTDSLGKCSFTSLPAGTYSLYNVGIAPDACPPTLCGFPSGYTGTTTPRRKDFTLAAATTSAQSFTYDKPVPWSVYNGGNPPTFAMTTSDGADLATGALINLPNISNNGMGYCMQDNLIYGSSGRSGVGSTTALSYPFTYTTNSLVGDCDDKGYFYSPATANSFTCICVNPYSPSYLRACNPYNNFAETTSPYYVTYTVNGTFNSADWSYVPSIQSIVGNNNSNYNEMFVLSLTTPESYYVPISGTKPQVTGITFSDNKNFYQPTGTRILKFEMYTTIAYGTVLSSSTLSYTGDGCRAVGAPVFYAAPEVVKKVNRIIASTSDQLIYTVTVVNAGIVDGLTSTFIDTLPTGLSYIPGTLTLNGVSQGSSTPESLNIGSLPIGKVFTVTFTADILSDTILKYTNYASVNTTYFDSATSQIFDTTFDSNIVTTTIIGNYLTTSKTLDKFYGIVGDILTYTIVTQNIGVTIANSVRIIDTMPNGATFVSGSLYSNGVNVPSGSVLPPSGFLVGTLASGAVSTISFKVNVVSVPSNYTVTNYGTAAYTSTTSFGTLGLFVDTNTVATIIKFADFSNIKKSVDKAFATTNETVTYTISLSNSGNTDALNVIFADTIPNGTTFINGSLTVNNVPNAGSINSLNLGTILVGETITIIYQVTIN